jgi:hypothetical protein
MKATYTLKLEPETIGKLKKRAEILGMTHTAYSRHLLNTAVKDPAYSKELEEKRR